MATSNIPTPKTLNINDKSAAVLWKAWRKTWNRFEIATGIDEASDKKIVCTLLSVIGDDAVKVYDAFQYSAGENQLDDVLRKFEEHCNPRQNIIFERYKFKCRNQEAGESGAQYMTELRHAADNCDFGGITTSQIIRDRFVHGLRERLLREKDLTLERSYEMVQAAEATAVQTRIMQVIKRCVLYKPQTDFVDVFKFIRTKLRQRETAVWLASTARMTMVPEAAQPMARSVGNVEKKSFTKQMPQ